MTVQLTSLLEHVLDGEPEAGDAVDEIFRRADRLRRRRTRALLAAGLAAVVVIVVAGWLLTTTLMPAAGPDVKTTPATAGAVTAPPAVADRVLALLAPVAAEKKMDLAPRPPERGDGWRQYSVTDRDGKPRGTLEVAVYAVRDDLCFPVTAAPGSCAKTEWAPAGIEYVRYDDDQDPGWQVHETIARRISDGRTVVVMATGERDAGRPSDGKPGLTGAQVEKVATDKRLFDAFGPDEKCPGPAADACPVFKVPVPAGQID
ncbi:hypothetical protein ACQP2F_08495 [Actinoplanes sp. CA-030573]|uniref:hypothetical protein n=1 Tax=Actinoplanes sp. CA-030573 TaxID=3239898 RepID=UPI003D89D881